MTLLIDRIEYKICQKKCTDMSCQLLQELFQKVHVQQNIFETTLVEERLVGGQKFVQYILME